MDSPFNTASVLLLWSSTSLLHVPRTSLIKATELSKSLQGCPDVLGQVSAEDQSLLGCQSLPVHMVLLQLLVAGVPQPRQDALNVQGVDCV